MNELREKGANETMQDKLVFTLVVANLLQFGEKHAEELVSLAGSRPTVSWCSGSVATSSFLSWILSTLCAWPLLSCLLAPFYIGVGVLSILALWRNRLGLARLALAVLVSCFLCTVGMGDSGSRLGYSALPFSQLVVFQIAAFLIFFKQFSSRWLIYSLSILALSYAPSRFSRDWVLGTFLSSGNWCGFCQSEIGLTAITLLAVLIGIVSPLFFISSRSSIRLVSSGLWTVSEVFVMDAGLGNAPNVYAYSLLLPLVWAVFGPLADLSERQGGTNGKPCCVDLPLIQRAVWVVFVLCSILNGLAVAPGYGQSGLLAYSPLPAHDRLDQNMQCLTSIALVPQEGNADANPIPDHEFQANGVLARCQPFVFLSKLRMLCDNFGEGKKLHMTIDVSRNGEQFCREYEELMPCSEVNVVERRRLPDRGEQCRSSLLGFPRKNPLLRRVLETSWARS